MGNPLANLIKKQKELQDDSARQQSAGATVEAGPQPAAESSVSPAPAARRLNFLKPSAGAKPAPASSDSPPAQPTAPVHRDGNSLDSLAALANSTEVDVADAKPEKPVYDFAPDYIEATAPIRDLPHDLDDAQKKFVEALDSLYETVFDAELLGQVCTSIMIELQANPQFDKLVADQDIRTMVIAARNSMGLARVKKTEKTRRTSGSKASAGRKSAASAEVMGVADAMFGEGDW